MGQIRVLVVDDSLLMQRVLSDLMHSDKHITVIGTARNGEEALEKIPSLQPDVVTMDVEMPKMNGLTAVRKIMETDPIPVVMISAFTQNEAQLTFKAMEFGAVDYVPKPSGPISLNMESVREELLFKIKTAATANITASKTLVEEPVEEHQEVSDKVICMAASTGGPQALTQVLRALPPNIPPLLIVQHMPKVMTKHFADGLNDSCKFAVKEAREGDRVQEALALIAPGGFHMTITKNKRIHLTQDPPVNFVRPSADVLMKSAAKVFQSKNIGVILTGMGCDGAAGIRAIKENGGATIAQDKQTSVVYGMPKIAFETGCIDTVASLDGIPREILKLCN